MLKEQERDEIADALRAVVSSVFDLCCASENLNDAFNLLYEREADEEGAQWEIAEGSLRECINNLRGWVKSAQELPSCPFVEEAHNFLFG